MSEFYSIKEVKSSQKMRKCAECRKPIAVGQSYRSCSGKDEGEFWTMDVHAECQIWASAILYDGGDGRGLLCQENPSDDLEPDELKDRIRANPPSNLMISRLPPMWLVFVNQMIVEGSL